MYEEITYERILKRMLERTPEGFDKREGSILYDALAPAAVELQNIYIELDWMMQQTFADTAHREYLIKRAGERGIEPYPSTKALLKGEFNLNIPLGARFSLERLNYKAVEKVGDGIYKMECETHGSEGNRYLGTLIPIDYISGLTRAELTDVFIPGEDEEETEHLRKRYFDSLTSQAFGGNIADYKEKVNSLPGVGGVKVFPVWDGGGTVKIVLIDSEYDAPSEELVSRVKEALDPEGYEGEGYGIAPIGHSVTVEAVKAVLVSIKTSLTYQNGWSYDACREKIYATVDGYIKELNRQWQDKDSTIVRISQIESRLLDIEGILDVADTVINDTHGNLELSANAIAVRGDFDGS